MKRLLIISTVCSVLATMVATTPARAIDAHDTVISEKGSIVTSTSGACVRSKWEAGSDICAPAAEPEPEKKPIAQVPPSPEPAREMRTVYFDFNKSDLTASGAHKLDTLIAWLTGAKGVTGAKIIGFADQIGNAEYNQKLSEARASTVQSYLRGKGVILPTNVEVVKGMGEDGSVTQCDAKMKRAEQINCLSADRRVEIQFDIMR